MTNIKIEKKKPGRISLLSALGLVVLFLNLMGCNIQGTEAKENVNTEDTVNTGKNNSTVAAYINFVAADDNKMTLDHAYSNEALLKLIDATNAMAGEVQYNVNEDLGKAKEFADKITKDPSETSHADNIRKSAEILTTVLQNMQQAKFPSLTNEADALKKATDSINPDVLTLNQRDAVKSFFGKAADLLQKMN